VSALRDWRPLATQGDANAQYRLGALYSEVQDLTQNHVKSRQWYKKAAVYHSGLK
jgi:TPR repeat protein